MGVVDEGLQFVGGAKAAGGSEEVGDVVTEGPIVGVLGDGHHLDGVVAKASDTREDEGAEFLIGADAFALGGDAKVGFVDAGGGGLGRGRIFPLIRVVGMPNGAGELVVLGVLECVAGERGEAEMGAIVAHDTDFVVREMGEGVGGESEGPVTFLIASGGMGVVVPVVEVAYERKLMSAGGIFAISPFLVFLIEEKSVGAVEVGVCFEGRVSQFFKKAVSSADDGIVVGSEPRVFRDEGKFFRHNR